MRVLTFGSLLVSMSVVACSGGSFDVSAVEGDSALSDDSAAASDSVSTGEVPGDDGVPADSTTGDSTTADSTTADSTMVDSTMVDSTTVDSTTDSATVDSTTTNDGATDARPLDVGTVDSADAAKQDANLQDTKTQDTSVQDSTLDAAADAMNDARDARADQGTDAKDSAVATDTANGCPRPPSTATIATEGLSCEDLEAKYVSLLQDAQECQCDGECGTLVSENFCDSCSAVVNPATDAYAQMVLLRKAWDFRVSKGQCQVKICPQVVCIVPQTGQCTAQLVGSTCRSLGPIGATN